MSSEPPIRLLIVDDSPFLRIAVRSILKTVPRVEVVGEAGDGQEAIEMAESLTPDLITMDINMPVLDGLEATRRIVARRRIPVLVLSSLATNGAEASFRALECGAVDFIAKTGSAMDVDLSSMGSELIDKILFWGGNGLAAGTADGRGAEPPAFLAELPADEVDVLAIAGGTGAPGQISEILAAWPVPPFPIVIAQKMAPAFNVAFVDFLVRTTGKSVGLAQARQPLVPGTLTVLPGGKDGRIERSGADLVLTMKRGIGLPIHPSEDVLFPSIAEAAFNPVGVFLSGQTASRKPRAALAFKEHSLPLAVLTPEACVAPALVQSALEADAALGRCSLAELASGFGRWIGGDRSRSGSA